MQCQPACFHTAPKANFSEDVRIIDTPQSNWHENACRVVPDAVATYMKKPFFRDEKKYLLRVNDMPTGFFRVPSKDSLGCGFTYENNRAYCYYYDRIIKDNKECSYTALSECQ